MSFHGAGPNAVRYERTSSARPSTSPASSGPTQSSASASRSARRRSHVPDGGTRTRLTHSPALPTNPLASPSSSLTVRGPSASAARSRPAWASIAASVASRSAAGRVRMNHSRSGVRTATACSQYCRRVTTWIVPRMSVPWISVRSSSAAVTAARSTPRTRDHSPT